MVLYQPLTSTVTIIYNLPGKGDWRQNLYLLKLKSKVKTKYFHCSALGVPPSSLKHVKTIKVYICLFSLSSNLKYTLKKDLIRHCNAINSHICPCLKKQTFFSQYYIFAFEDLIKHVWIIECPRFKLLKFFPQNI